MKDSGAIRQRYANLDVIKGVCIVMVIIHHSLMSERSERVLLFPFWIYMAVPIFMVITGYVSGLSFSRRTPFSLRDAYRPVPVITKCLRYILPYIPVFILEIAYYAAVLRVRYSPGRLLVLFLRGGHGLGSYYFPVILQLVFLLPLIWYVIDRWEFRGLIGCFVFTVLFEAVKAALHMPIDTYRICSLRYVFIVSFGCWLYRSDCRKNAAYWAACAVGIAYLILTFYVGLKPLITDNGTWTKTSVFAVLYLLPILRFAVGRRSICCGVLEWLGQASYEIFLSQMLYYLVFATRVYAVVPSTGLRILLNCLICCAMGLLFWLIERPITDRIIRRIRETARPAA